MGRFSDSPYFLLETFFDGLGSTEPIEKPINEFDWGVHFMSSFEPEYGVREYGHEEYTVDNTTNGPQEVVFTDWKNAWNRREYYDPNLLQTFSSYIVAPFINIAGEGGGIMDLFVKEPDVGYQQITARYNGRDGNQFNFINSGIKEWEPGENITDVIYQEEMYTNSTHRGDKYYFTFWDKIGRDTFGLFENDREAYFRKDSLYHDFLKIYAADMVKEQMGVEIDVRNYVNSDKLFSYFHNIYKSHDDQEARIIFDGMKDYVMRAVPSHQRTPRFTELCEIFFDQLYQEVFDLLKNVWSLIDPMEVDEGYLGYLSQYYDMFDVEVESATLLQIREFIRDMIWMIKRKGTYTEFYILWRILTGTKNILSVYERWHQRDVEDFPDWPSTISPPCTGTWPNFPQYSDTNNTTVVPSGSWTDVLYWNREEYGAPEVDFGAGRGWYGKWYPNIYESEYTAPSVVHCPSGSFLGSPVAPSGFDNLMLSTHYILETDISSEPLTSTEILTEDIWDTMNQYWEYVRPVNRVSNYRIVVAPITDISGKYIHLYEVSTKSSAYLKTMSGVALDLVDGAYVHQQDEIAKTRWQINHGLGESILLQVFDENLDEIVPSGIEYDGNIAFIDFDTPTLGYVIIKRADWTSTRPNPVTSTSWKFYHSQLQKEVIVHYKYGSDRFYAGGTSLDDPEENVSDNATAELADTENNTAMVGMGNYIHYQPTPSAVWDIDHEQGIKGNILVIYEENAPEDDARVHPSRYHLVDSDNCRVEFDEPTAGYAVFIWVGDISIEDLLEELDKLTENCSWIAYSHDDQGNPTEVDRGYDVTVTKDDDYYYFTFGLSTEPTYTINEIKVYDKNGWSEHDENILFHSLMSNLYKPPRTDLTFHYRLSIPTEE